MSKFAITAPIHILEEFDKSDTLGNYNFFIVSDVLKYQKRYAKLFQMRMGTKILDNGLIEHGGAYDIDAMQAAVALTNASHYVLPDAYLDTWKTIGQIKEALPIWSSRMPQSCQPIFIPQGLTLEQFTFCAEELFRIGHEHLGMWGIPKNLTGQIGSRRQAIEICRAINPYWKIHLFGFSDNFIDDITCAKYGGVTGIDSAVPLRIANQGVPWSLIMKVPRRGDWWEKAEFNEEMFVNVLRVRGLIRE